MTKERKERIEELREWLGGILAWNCGSEESQRNGADFLALLNDHEAALPLLEAVRKSCPEYLQGELMDLRRLRAKHESEILSEALPILRAALAYGERRNSSINGYPDSVKRVLAPPEPVTVTRKWVEDFFEGGLVDTAIKMLRDLGIAVEEEK